MTSAERSLHGSAAVHDPPDERQGEAEDALLAQVAAAIHARWTERPDAPLWVSTSGLGVPWLHVRLDDAPKYYTHRPFRDPR